MTELKVRLSSVIQRLGRQLLRLRHRRRIFLVEDTALAEAMRSSGILNPVQRGEVKCCHCHDTISLENLQGWHRNKDKVYVFCKKTSCQLLLEMEGK